MGRALVVVMAFGAALLGAGSAASESTPTTFARPALVGWAEGATLFGTAPGARANDVIPIQVKECGSATFRPYAEAHANAGGGWSLPVGTAVTSTFRAVWKGQASAPATIRQEARVVLERRRLSRLFSVTAFSMRSLWHRQVEVQRRSGGAWKTVKRVRLTDSVSSTGQVSVSQAPVALRVPRGTNLRAVLPLDQAQPCYVRSISRMVKT